MFTVWPRYKPRLASFRESTHHTIMYISLPVLLVQCAGVWVVVGGLGGVEHVASDCVQGWLAGCSRLMDCHMVVHQGGPSAQVETGVAGATCWEGSACSWCLLPGTTSLMHCATKLILSPR
jgi:hypothetical protein